MSVALIIDSIATELGTGDFVHAFFSTISGHLEPQWGVRFPALMLELYQGTLPKAHAAQALEELRTARRELLTFSPTEVIWDIEDRAKRPPWGMNIASDITSLSNYFVTSTGRDMFDALIECLEYLRDDAEGPATIGEI